MKTKTPAVSNEFLGSSAINIFSVLCFIQPTLKFLSKAVGKHNYSQGLIVYFFNSLAFNQTVVVVVLKKTLIFNGNLSATPTGISAWEEIKFNPCYPSCDPNKNSAQSASANWSSPLLIRTGD